MRAGQTRWEETVDGFVMIGNESKTRIESVKYVKSIVNGGEELNLFLAFSLTLAGI